MLHVHRAERADGLVDALAALLAQPLEDPFAPEVTDQAFEETIAVLRRSLTG